MLCNLGLSAVLHGTALATVIILAARAGPPPHVPQPPQAAMHVGLDAETAPIDEDVLPWATLEFDTSPWPTPPDDVAAPTHVGNAPLQDVPDPAADELPVPETARHAPAVEAPPAPSLAVLRREAARRRTAHPTPHATRTKAAGMRPTPPPARTPPRATRPRRGRPQQRTRPRRTGHAAAAAPLQVLHAPDPSRYYPQAARRARLEGHVLVRITIDPRGVVTHAVVERGSGSRLLDDAARALARDYRFSAAAHARVARLPVVFELGPLPAAGRRR